MSYTGYYSPDLTGTDPNYLQENDTYVISVTGQKINFGQPIYAASVVATLISTLNVTLVEGIDWSYQPSDIDVTATSKLLTIDADFTAVLIDSIEITRVITTPITIAFNYQQLYPVIDKAAVFDNSRVDLTPDLILDMRNRIHNLELLVQTAESTSAISTSTPKLLPIDLTGVATTNLITNETYYVNVLQSGHVNQNVIFPVSGSFYATGVIVTQADGSGVVLTVDTDYQLYGLNVDKTRVTDSTSAVYDFIIVSKPYVGNLHLTYQAFGGEPTLQDVTTIYGVVQSLATYIENTPFVTAPGLATSPILLSIINRMNSMEAQMRNLINAGNPTYGDVSGNGTAILLKIRSVDTNLHWWNMASLYKVDGSSQIITADRMHFRIQMANGHVSADVFVNVDMNVSDVFTIDSIAVNLDPQYTIGGSTGTNPVVMPAFRILYNVGGTSGITLQIGVQLFGLADTIAIEDLSGTQSCWLLLQSPPTIATLPQDNTITLPDTVSIWDTSNDESVAIIHMMPYETGYLAWSGTPISMSTVGTAAIPTILPTSFNIPDIQEVDLIWTTASNELIKTIIPVVPTTTSGIYGGATYVPSSQPDGSPTLVNIAIQRSGSTVTIAVSPELFYSLSTTLLLSQIIVRV